MDNHSGFGMARFFDLPQIGLETAGIGKAKKERQNSFSSNLAFLDLKTRFVCRNASAHCQWKSESPSLCVSDGPSLSLGGLLVMEERVFKVFFFSFSSGVFFRFC